MKTLTLGYSPCPNDTFIFYALAHKKIDTGNLAFTETLLDVETLNQMALAAQLDVTKVSYHAFGLLRDTYCLLRAGGALGMGCGPLIVAKKDTDIRELKGKTIAIPGRLTTAFLLLQIFDPGLCENTKSMPFDTIIDAVKDGNADAGLIIHESRFTYTQAGLAPVLDLGDWWEKESGLPIPLGCILAKRDLGYEAIQRIDTLIRESIEYAFSHRQETKSYIKRNAHELDDDVIEQHITLYVNNYSIDIGSVGITAVRELFKRAEERGILRKSSVSLFALE